MGKEDIILSPCRVTVLKAPSETGKSVVSNFLTDFVKTEYDKDVFNSIVRRGCNSGGLAFRYDDGSCLLMLMQEETKVMCYQSGDQEQDPEMFYDAEINELSLERFGIVVDNKNEMLINVFSRNNPLLFVDTDEFFNGSLLSRVLIERDVERLQDYLKLQEEKLKEYIKEINPIKLKLDYQESTLQYTDIVSLRDLEKEALYLKTFCNTSYSVERRLEELSKIVKYDKEVLDLDLGVLEHDKQLVTLVEQISRAIDLYKEIVLPTECDITVEEVSDLRDNLTFLLQIGQAIRTLPEVSDLEEETTNLIKEISCMLLDVQALSSLKREFDKLRNTEQEIVENSVQLNKSEKELTELKLLIKTCPLCGSDL